MSIKDDSIFLAKLKFNRLCWPPRRRMCSTTGQLIWTQQPLHPCLLSLGDPVILLQLSCWHTWLRSCSSPGTSSEIHDYSQQGCKAIVVPANLATPKPPKKAEKAEGRITFVEVWLLTSLSISCSGTSQNSQKYFSCLIALQSHDEMEPEIRHWNGTLSFLKIKIVFTKGISISHTGNFNYHYH